MTDGGSFYPAEIGLTATPPQPNAPAVLRARRLLPKPQHRRSRNERARRRIEGGPSRAIAQRDRSRTHSFEDLKDRIAEGGQPPSTRSFAGTWRSLPTPAFPHTSIVRPTHIALPAGIVSSGSISAAASSSGSSRSARSVRASAARSALRSTRSPKSSSTARARRAGASRGRFARRLSALGDPLDAKASALSRCSPRPSAARAAFASPTSIKKEGAANGPSIRTDLSLMPAESTASRTITRGATCAPSLLITSAIPWYSRGRSFAQPASTSKLMRPHRSAASCTPTKRPKFACVSRRGSLRRRSLLALLPSAKSTRRRRWIRRRSPIASRTSTSSCVGSSAGARKPKSSLRHRPHAHRATSPATSPPNIRNWRSGQPSDKITKPAEAIAATGSDVFTHLPRLFGFLAETPLTPAWRFDRCSDRCSSQCFRLHWSRTIRSSHFEFNSKLVNGTMVLRVHRQAVA